MRCSFYIVYFLWNSKKKKDGWLSTIVITVQRRERQTAEQRLLRSTMDQRPSTSVHQRWKAIESCDLSMTIQEQHRFKVIRAWLTKSRHKVHESPAATSSRTNKQINSFWPFGVRHVIRQTETPPSKISTVVLPIFREQIVWALSSSKWRSLVRRSKNYLKEITTTNDDNPTKCTSSC